DGERAAAVGAGSGDDMVGNFLEIAVRGRETDLGVALIVVKEIETGVVRSPFGILNVAVELVVDGMGATAVAVHDVKLGGLVPLVTVVETGVSDQFSVGRSR